MNAPALTSPDVVPRYVPLPHQLLAPSVAAATLSVFLGVLSEFASLRLPVLKIFDSGRRPFLTARSETFLRARISAACGLGERVVCRELANLAARGFLAVRSLRRSVRLELSPTAFGWPEDLKSRCRTGTGRAERRYVPVPLTLVGRHTPADTATLVRVLAACGVGLFERVCAGEVVAVSLAERELAHEIGVSARTVRRALDGFERQGLLSRTNLGRAGIVVEIRPMLLGVVEQADDAPRASRTFSPEASRKAGISDVPLMHARSDSSKKEDLGKEVAARGLVLSHYRALYGALVAFSAIGRVTTPALRARTRRAALTLALADAPAECVLAIGTAVGREAAGASPERVAARVLCELRSRRQRETAHAQFRAPEPAPPACSLCQGLGHLFADGTSIGCPHDVTIVRSWAERRGWVRVTAPDGFLVLAHEALATPPRADPAPLPMKVQADPHCEQQVGLEDRRAAVLAGIRDVRRRLGQARQPNSWSEARENPV